MGSPDTVVARAGRAAVSRASSPRSGRPVLVTGVPRSGTTWLARELSAARGAGLAGREPMNPRGGQFALGGTLRGWVELTDPTPGQRRLLKRCYAGREPRTFSRYGSGQLRAVLPWTSTIVKDPFALLSVPAIVATTGAIPVVVYRPAGAVLASYRRMGWTADSAELRALPAGPTGPEPADDVQAMIEFWNHLHARVLTWLPQVPDTVVVSHADLTAAGRPGMADLARRLGLGELPVDTREPTRPAAQAGSRLHEFNRSASDVTSGWRATLTPDEVALVETETASIYAELERHAVRFG